ncbi:MAG: GAF domain-containing protein [Anaerolineae bacterium]|nr:GAF domain-containing protein [Anaerolineae bacterium]
MPAPSSKTLPPPTRERRLIDPNAPSLHRRWRIYMLVGMNALVIGIVIGAVIIALLEQRGAVLNLHQTTTSQTHAIVQHTLEQIEHTLIAAGSQPSAAELDRLRAAQPAIESISLVARTGAEIIHSPADNTRAAPDWTTDPTWLALTETLTEAESTESSTPVTVAQIVTTTQPAQLVLAVALPDTASALDTAPFLIATLDAQTLLAGVLTIDVGKSGYVYLLDDTGAMLATATARTNELDTNDAARPADFAVFTQSRNGGSTNRFYQGLDDAWVIGRGEHFPAAGYTIVVETPLSAYTPFLLRLVILSAFAILLTAAIGEGMIRFILRTVLNPLAQLRKGAREVTRGDYHYRVRLPANADREFAELGETFNRMIERLFDSQRQIDAYTNEMHEIIDQRARELARKATQLEVAAEVSHKIASELDRRELFGLVIDLIQEQFEVYHVEILQLEDGTGTLIPSTTRGEVVLPKISLRDAPHSVIAYAARHGEVVYVPDVSLDSRYLRVPHLPASQSELAIPLRFANAVLGVLNLEADHCDAFAKDDIAVLQSLANTIAVSMRNAQMFEALEFANKELMQASLQAKQANTLKSRFLFNASHKLRTPLNSIIGYSETILSGVYGDIPDTVLDRQRRILQNGRVLNALVEDMLDLSAIETGHLQLNLEWIELPPLLEDVVNATHALHSTAHADHDLDIRLDLSQQTEPLPLVWADLERLRYILINLTSNAVKFTPQGEVVLSADADEEWIHIHVRDTGEGISAGNINYLFQPFQHQQGSTGHEGKGTGLGLPVSRLLAMHHGGELTVQSAPNEGSTFTLNLPRNPVGAAPRPKG